jgi:NADP-dependent 3-hydroxy acid dehydrogenase YdfG
VEKDQIDPDPRVVDSQASPPPHESEVVPELEQEIRQMPDQSLLINTLSTAGLRIVPTMAVYAGSKNAVRAISEGLRREAGDKLRVTTVSPGYVHTELPSSMFDPVAQEKGRAAMEKMAMPAAAIADAIGQPDNVDVGEIVARPTAQA